MELQLRVFGFYQPRMWKQMQTKCAHDICAPCCASCLFIFKLRPQHIYTWRITVILIMGKTIISPTGVPCRDKDGAGSGIAGLYLWHTVITGPWLLPTCAAATNLDQLGVAGGLSALAPGNPPLQLHHCWHFWCLSTDSQFPNILLLFANQNTVKTCCQANNYKTQVRILQPKFVNLGGQGPKQGYSDLVPLGLWGWASKP